MASQQRTTRSCPTAAGDGRCRHGIDPRPSRPVVLTDARGDGQGHHGLTVARGRTIYSEGLKRQVLLEMQMRIDENSIEESWGSWRSGQLGTHS